MKVVDCSVAVELVLRLWNRWKRSDGAAVGGQFQILYGKLSPMIFRDAQF